MEKNQLRIGNILNYQLEESTLVPTRIDWQDLKQLTEDPKGFNLVHKPIPITEEWLLRFGFERMITQEDSFLLCLDEVFSLDSKDLIYNIKNNCVYINNSFDILEPLTTIEFVHQMQNIVFVIANKELQIKLKT